MVQPTKWFSRICMILLAATTAPVAAQLPDSPLRTSGQSSPLSPTPLSPTPLSPAPLGPTQLGPAQLPPAQLQQQPTPSSVAPTPLGSPLGPVAAGNNGLPSSLPNGPLPNGPVSSNPLMQPVGGLQPNSANSSPLVGGNGAIDRGVVQLDDSATFSANRNLGNTASNDPSNDIQRVNFESQAADGGLSPMEQRYSAWWREVLATANVSGDAVEVKSLLQNASGEDRIPMIREYWRLSEAIVAVHIHRESLETWQRATAQQSQQPLARTMVEMLNLQIEQANATVEAEQEHLGLWLQRHGMTQQPRPVDAPFLGSYDTKLSVLQQQVSVSTDLAVLAQQVDQRKQGALDDEQVIDWADQEWERARSSGDLQKMAAMLQMRQSAYLLWLSGVTRYNEAIAQYAFRVAGPNVPVPQQLAMLLRQPIVDGRLTDIRTDAWFRSAAASTDFREIAPVSYNQPQFGYDPAGGVTGNWQPARGR